LPRIAPLRLNSGLLWELDRWQARVDVEHASNQGRVPDNESGTNGYTTLGASAGYNFTVGRSQWLAFVKGDNLTDQTVRYASSILRDIAPAPGRSVEVGLHDVLSHTAAVGELASRSLIFKAKDRETSSLLKPFPTSFPANTVEREAKSP
jgi:hypothetical protein